ncbi:MAG: pantoate--beta-alanine ligase [Campylobacterales bacterium]|nr:pantoate--beta-alanine ligase [Campylobacterales bacterium]
MKQLKSVKELIEFRNKQKKKSVGFVPTMGAIHQGHTSLMERSVEENDITIVSIFVNPTQFLEGEDLSKYPRQLEKDLIKCEESGVDAVFTPSIDDIYEKNEPKVAADPVKGYILEGKNRPGHFDGMLTVVLKLLNLVRATRAYFGRKDAQQLILIEDMVKAFALKVQIVPCILVREKDGLAMSSRNIYLSKENREQALLIYKALNYGKMLITENDEKDPKVVKEAMLEILKPLDVEYVECTNRDLTISDSIEIENSIVLVAAKLGNTRLIDNFWI